MFDYFKKKIKETFEGAFKEDSKEKEESAKESAESTEEPKKEIEAQRAVESADKGIEESAKKKTEESTDESEKEREIQKTDKSDEEGIDEHADESIREKEEELEKECLVKSVKETLKETFDAVKKKAVEKNITQQELDDFFYNIELVLLENNASYDATNQIIENAKKQLLGTKADRFRIKEILEESLKNSIFDILDQKNIDIAEKIKEINKNNEPCVIVFLGFNGAGKTTNLAKLGYDLKNKGFKCVFAAADTFRSAAIEQLKKHADKMKIPVVSHQYGADSAAVIFDAKKYAAAHKCDVVLCDTAGRVHTDKNLMEELKKIKRVNNPHLMILVAESITGSDIENQVEVFSAIGIDGVILTKTDIDGKIGSAISVCYVSKKPILYLSCGQKYEDLIEFNAKSVLDSVFEK
ncbi:MAG: signal recognition particle-docking protein FtsY [Candidatus Aenigmarchaeota archaeon]|nr:signal recognition particle-docking protein FtsY [Candidatus Aenigmarchaeota archaeon]